MPTAKTPAAAMPYFPLIILAIAMFMTASAQPLPAPSPSPNKLRPIVSPPATPAPVRVPAPPETPAPSPGLDCMPYLLNLTDCLTYVESGSNTSKPDKGCCSELANLVNTQPICLCQLLGHSNQSPIPIDINRALKLPSVCNVTTPPVSLCAAIGGVPVGAVPAGAPGPGVAPIPGGFGAVPSSGSPSPSPSGASGGPAEAPGPGGASSVGEGPVPVLAAASSLDFSLYSFLLLTIILPFF